MSYILEALRRAEAERSAGRTPDVRSIVEAAAVPDAADPMQRRRLSAIIVGLALLGILIAAGVWAAMALRAPVSPVPAAAGSLGGAATIAASGVPIADDKAIAPALPDEPPRLMVPRMAVIESEAPPPPVSPSAAVKPATPATPATQASPGSASRASATQAPAAATPGRPSPVAASPAAPSASAGVPAREQLPADVRRTLPPISIGGTVYSSDPAQRLLIVDGELWREGDQVRPDLVIEQIRQRDAVLRYRGVRFSVSP